MRRIEIEIGGQWVENPVTYLPGVIGTATLLDDEAPQICEGLWNALPIETRTIHAFNAGQTWRTEKNYQIAPEGVVENFDQLDKISRRILYEGPKNVTIRRKE